MLVDTLCELSSRRDRWLVNDIVSFLFHRAFLQQRTDGLIVFFCVPGFPFFG